MKKLLLLLLCLPMIGFGQLTYVPDNWFEAYLENNGMGNGIQYDDNVFTAAIDTVTYLDLSYGAGQAIGVFDLTGIEDFTNLKYLDCSYNLLTSLDLSQNTALEWFNVKFNQLNSLDVSYNTALTYLFCENNPLTSLDLSNNTVLTYLECINIQLISLDLSNNTALTSLFCENNQLTILDLSINTALTHLWCQNNQLATLDLRNGNNTNVTSFKSYNNSNLTCINVDNATWSTANWTVANGNIDAQHYFSNNCTGTAIEEHTTNRELLRTIDLLGRETPNQPLFYIYDDGSVEKKIIIE